MFLNILLDIVLIFILIGGSHYGYNKGLFKLALAPSKILLSLFISFSFSGIVGEDIIAPFIISRINISHLDYVYHLVRAVSWALAFILLFAIFKILISIVIRLLNEIFEIGIIGIMNRALGFLLSGVISFMVAMFLSSLLEYFLATESINADLIGGPIYWFFKEISPFKTIFTNF